MPYIVLSKHEIIGGLKSHIFNKMKDTYRLLILLIGEKNNTLISRPVQVKDISYYKSFTNEKVRTLKSKSRKDIRSYYVRCAYLFHTTQVRCAKAENINFYGYIFKNKFHTRVRASSRIGPHNIDVISIIIGSLLGDGNANSRTIEGTRLCFRQSVIHKDYLFWLYKFFNDKGYCSNLAPRMSERKLLNKYLQETKIYYGYEFNTFTFRSFNWIHKLFYKKGKKYINPDLIKYITPLALAIWIMDEGGWAKAGVRLSTNAFKLEEVKYLAGILTSKWGLKCTVQKLSKSNQYSIYILGESLPKLKKLVLPHIIPSMKYKLGAVFCSNKQDN
uniref:LAGLIDADG n=2 Tax=Rhynchosporium TaxID=38037 RepID=V5W619_9HELO|nr:LAGLIDADG [Rhynchosporium agropyri]YP_008965373.1 LAGLIDADG [Rhynchosporium commune]AHC02305.1 LAGLIDADG [Rhynchosporium agropyri]AHC02351.1 LAGLIDADG [Rhynchosporium commune]